MKLLFASSLALLATLAAASPDTWASAIVGVSNISAPGQGIHGLADGSSNGSVVTAQAAQSFTGLDGSGATQTMDFSGTATTSSEFGRLHSYTTGTLTNSYYNASNVAYQNPDGSVNPAGSPDSLVSLGFSGFTDTLQFGGALQAGYKARYIFHFDGTNSGIGYLSDLAVKIGNDDTEAFFDADPGYHAATWATIDHEIDGTNPQDIYVQFSNQVVFDTFHLSDGGNYAGTCDFSSTVTLSGIEVVDASGNLVTGWTVTSGSGTIYPQAVPEPASLLALGLGGLVVLRRRKA